MYCKIEVTLLYIESNNYLPQIFTRDTTWPLLVIKNPFPTGIKGPKSSLEIFAIKKIMTCQQQQQQDFNKKIYNLCTHF